MIHKVFLAAAATVSIATLQPSHNLRTHDKVIPDDHPFQVSESDLPMNFDPIIHTHAHLKIIHAHALHPHTPTRTRHTK